MGIQESKKEDFKEIVKLWNQEYKHLTTSKIKISVKKFENWYNFREKTGYIYYSIRHKNKFAGLLFLQKKEKELLIKAVAVKKKYRNLNLGGRLIKKAIETSKRFNLPLMAEVLVNNIDAINWFVTKRFFIIKFNKKTSDWLMMYFSK